MSIRGGCFVISCGWFYCAKPKVKNQILFNVKSTNSSSIWREKLCSASDKLNIQKRYFSTTDATKKDSKVEEKEWVFKQKREKSIGVQNQTKYKHFLDIAREKQEVSYNQEIFSSLNNREIEKALSLYTEMKTKNRVPQMRTINFLIHNLGKARRFKQAAQVFEDITTVFQIKPDFFTFSTIIDCFGKAGYVLRAEEYFKIMTEKYHLIPSKVVFNTMIDIFGRANLTEKVEYYLQLMEDFNLDADLITYTTLISNAPSVEKAEEYFQKYIRRCEGVKEKSISVMDVDTKELIQSYKREASDAEERFSVKFDTVTFVALINKCAKKGAYQKAESYLHMMIYDYHVTPNLVVFNSLISNTKSWEKAVYYFSQIEVHNLIPDIITFTALLPVCSQAKRGDLVELYFHLMQEKYHVKPNLVCYNAMISFCRDMQSIENILMSMKQSKVVPDLFTFNTLIISCSDYESAIKIFNLMSYFNYRPNIYTFNALLRVCITSGDFQRGETIFREVEGKYELKPTIQIFSPLIYLFAISNQTEKMHSYYHKMIDYNVTPDIASFNVLIQYSSNFEESMFYWNELLNWNIQPTLATFHVLLIQLGKADMFSKMKEYFEVMQFKYHISPDTVIYNTMIKYCPTLEDAQTYYNMLCNSKGITPGSATIDCIVRNMILKYHRPDLVEPLIDDAKSSFNIVLKDRTLSLLGHMKIGNYEAIYKSSLASDSAIEDDENDRSSALHYNDYDNNKTAATNITTTNDEISTFELTETPEINSDNGDNKSN